MVDNDPHVLLLDYHLDEKMTGLQLRKRLQESLGNCPTIAITPDHSKAIRAEVAAAGCQILPKLLESLALKSVMARLLGTRA